MADQSITMDVDETLELDYIVKQISEETITVTSEPTDGSATINHINKSFGVFNPSETGIYKLDIDGQIVTIDVTNIPSSEADQKLKHRWYLSEDNDPFIDQVGTVDGTNSGTSKVTGPNFVKKTARRGNGTDSYIKTGTLGNFGSDLEGNYAIAFSVYNLDTNGSLIQGNNTNNETLMIISTTGEGSPNFPNGTLSHFTRPSDLTRNKAVTGTTDLTTGGPYRCVINVPNGTEPSTWEIYINQSEEVSSIKNSSWTSSPSNFNVDTSFFASPSGGNTSEVTLDDICIFNSSLTATEAKSYNNPWT
jgi:hypothetical protein